MWIPLQLIESNKYWRNEIQLSTVPQTISSVWIAFKTGNTGDLYSHWIIAFIMHCLFLFLSYSTDGCDFVVYDIGA